MPTTFLSVANNAESTLASGISDTDVSLTVASGHGSRFPSTFPFHITIDNEIIAVGARSGDVLSSLTRAQQGTLAASHLAAATVELRVTAKSVSDLNVAVRGVENRELERDFGSTPVFSKAFLAIVDADVAASSLITIVQSAEAPTGKSQDENEMDGLLCRATPGVGPGTFDLYVDALPGPVIGNFKFNYRIS